MTRGLEQATNPLGLSLPDVGPELTWNVIEAPATLSVEQSQGIIYGGTGITNSCVSEQALGK